MAEEGPKDAAPEPLTVWPGISPEQLRPEVFALGDSLLAQVSHLGHGST